jgi:hypothetical protein
LFQDSYTRRQEQGEENGYVQQYRHLVQHSRTARHARHVKEAYGMQARWRSKYRAAQVHMVVRQAQSVCNPPAGTKTKKPYHRTHGEGRCRVIQHIVRGCIQYIIEVGRSLSTNQCAAGTPGGYRKQVNIHLQATCLACRKVHPAIQRIARSCMRMRTEEEQKHRRIGRFST